MDHIGARDCGPRLVYVVKGAIGGTSKRPDRRRRFNASRRRDTFHIQRCAALPPRSAASWL